MHATSQPPAQEPWYRYGVAILLLEMALAIAVGAYALCTTFSGPAGN